MRPKPTRWCSRKPPPLSTSTSNSSPESTLPPTVWTPPILTPSPSGMLAASLVWTSVCFMVPIFLYSFSDIQYSVTNVHCHFCKLNCEESGKESSAAEPKPADKKNLMNCFDFSCAQLPVRGSRPPAQQSQVLQQWQLWLHPQACLHVWRSAHNFIILIWIKIVS